MRSGSYIAIFASSRLAAWVIIHLLSPIDRVILRQSNGRVSLTLGVPMLLLTTIGARSGKRRMTPLLYVADGDNFAVISSRGGNTHHPAWYLNLRANPQVTVLLHGCQTEFVARDAQGDEQERLWQSALEKFKGFQVYSQRGRPANPSGRADPTSQFLKSQMRNPYA